MSENQQQPQGYLVDCKACDGTGKTGTLSLAHKPCNGTGKQVIK